MKVLQETVINTSKLLIYAFAYMGQKAFLETKTSLYRSFTVKTCGSMMPMKLSSSLCASLNLVSHKKYIDIGPIENIAT